VGKKKLQLNQEFETDLSNPDMLLHLRREGVPEITRERKVYGRRGRNHWKLRSSRPPKDSPQEGPEIWHNLEDTSRNHAARCHSPASEEKKREISGREVSSDLLIILRKYKYSNNKKQRKAAIAGEIS